VRGGDLSCEGSSSGKLVGDAAVWPRTGRPASEGLDEDLHACNTPCFCLVVICDNDTLNYSSNYS
jgi:hypothetical protein